MRKSAAVVKYETKWWKTSTPEEIVQFQLYEELLCMPFEDFHIALETVLGRGVFSHELGFPALLRKEYEGDKERPSLTEAYNLFAKGMHACIE